MNLLDRIFGPTSLFYNLLRWLGISPEWAVFGVLTILVIVLVVLLLTHAENKKREKEARAFLFHE